MGAGGVEEAGEPDHCERRLAAARGGLLQAHRRRHVAVRRRDRGREQHRDRLDRFHHRLRQHASGVVLLPRGRGTAVKRVCLLLALLPAALRGQATGIVYGSVRDTAGRPVRSATVTVSGSAAKTITDARGRYRLTEVLAGRTGLGAQMIGYLPALDTVTVAAGDSLQHDFVLRASIKYAIVDTFRLTPIVVTAGKRQQSLQDVIASVALVSDSQIARRAVASIDEAVDRAPGVQFLNGQVNIRGSTGYVQGLGSRVLLLVDGVPANQGDRGGINWDLLPVDNVERVEVVKGAGSALYGSAALGGVVNLITRDIPDDAHARLRLIGGSFPSPPPAL